MAERNPLPGIAPISRCRTTLIRLHDEEDSDRRDLAEEINFLGLRVPRDSKLGKRTAARGRPCRRVGDGGYLVTAVVPFDRS
jgi:hypothetical protein